ncbi:MAG: DASS family sodium-coupled anion symporter [Candidatus Neomarinimicrobiota bacterium]
MDNKNLKKLYPIIAGVVLWIIGPPSGLNENGYQIFVVFISVIISLLVRAVPMAISVLTGLSFSVLVGLISLKDALKGYSDSTTWLVVIAFLIAGVVIDTGLGRRISLLCIHALGKSIIGLGYALCTAELILGPLVPSNTARGGGILAPIVDSMSRTLGSSPNQSPEKAGQYLHLIGAHANLITAAMFLTGMAANPLISKIALDIFQIEFDWLNWALGSIVPGLVGLAGLPVLIKYLSPPTIKSIQPIREKVKDDIKAIGPWTLPEIITILTLGMMLFLWSTKPIHGWGTTTVALLGLITILLLGTISWDQMVKNYKAWDTLIWLGGLITLATSLKNLGFISWFAENIQQYLTGISPLLLFLSLALIYFYSMYFFSMLTAHIMALVSAIFMIASGLDLNPFIIVGVIAYFSNLSGCLTNYSTGPIIIYFGNGYLLPLPWFKIGFLVSIYHMVVWFGIGSIWWRIIGWW